MVWDCKKGREKMGLGERLGGLGKEVEIGENGKDGVSPWE